MMKPIKFLLAATLLFFLFSCEEDTQSTDYNANIATAKDVTLTEDIFRDVFGIIFQSGYDTALHASGQKEILGATVFYQAYEDSVIINVHYPDWPLYCPDDLYRQGTFRLKLDEELYVDNAEGTLNFNAFAVQYMPVYGSMNIRNMGVNNDSLQKFSVSYDQLEILTQDSVSFIKVSSDRQLVWKEGSDTPQNFSDDLLLIEGSASGKSADGIEFSTQIITPLGISDTCFYIYGGEYSISTPGLEIKEGAVKFFSEEECPSRFEMYFDSFRFYEEFLFLYKPPVLD